MNINFYFEKLMTCESYKNFIKENPEAFLVSGFFIIDKKGNDNKQHFDYFSPKKDNDKIFSFQLEEGGNISQNRNLSDDIPEKLSLDYDISFKEVEKKIRDEMQIRSINEDIEKIIFSLQKFQGEEHLIGTVFISKLGMIKLKIGLKDKKITDFEKKSLFDMVNVFKKKE